jgi:hypothetical protein
MECDFNLLCYGLFKIPKTIIILKEFLLRYFFICLIASWFEIGNGKKNIFDII